MEVGRIGSEEMNNDLIIDVAKRTSIVSVIVVGVLAIAFKESKPIILGYLFGTFISIVSFKLISNTLESAVKKEPSKAKLYAAFHYGMRMVIYGLALTLATKADYLNLFTTALGLTMVKNTIVLSTIFDKNFS